LPGGHRELGCGDLRAARKVVKAAGGKVRVALVGTLESRIAMWVVRFAISTQALPSPPPEYDDFCHW
jgi:hypothetical protein